MAVLLPKITFLPVIIFVATDLPEPGVPKIAILAFDNSLLNVSKFIGRPVNKSLPKYMPSDVSAFALAIGNSVATPSAVIFLVFSSSKLLFIGNVSFNASNCLK